MIIIIIKTIVIIMITIIIIITILMNINIMVTNINRGLDGVEPPCAECMGTQPRVPQTKRAHELKHPKEIARNEHVS